MPAMPAPSPEETRDNTTFEALLWALSRPGQVRALPVPGESAIITALLDRECRVHSADPLLIPDIMRTGADIAEIGAADHVFLGASAGPDMLAHIAIGSDLYPDDGATVFARARIGEGQGLRLSGPGIDGEMRLSLGGLPAGLWAARDARLRYPMGFDMFFLDGARLVGVPRSTLVEVL